MDFYVLHNEVTSHIDLHNGEKTRPEPCKDQTKCIDATLINPPKDTNYTNLLVSVVSC